MLLPCVVQVQPFYRATTALMQLNRLGNAQVMLQLGFGVLGKVAPLQQLHKRIQTVAAAQHMAAEGASARQEAASSSTRAGSTSGSTVPPTSRASSGKSPAASEGQQVQHLTERDAKEMQGKVSVERVAADNAVASMVARSGAAAGRGSGRAAAMVDDRVPKFHEEVSKAGRCVLPWVASCHCQAHKQCRQAAQSSDDCAWITSMHYVRHCSS